MTPRASNVPGRSPPDVIQKLDALVEKVDDLMAASKAGSLSASVPNPCPRCGRERYRKGGVLPDLCSSCRAAGRGTPGPRKIVEVECAGCPNVFPWSGRGTRPTFCPTCKRNRRAA